MLTSTNGINLFLVAIVSFILILLQVIFGYLMRKHRNAFLKYHRVIGVVIMLLVFLNMFLSPTIFVIGFVVFLLVLTQVIIGVLLTKGKMQLLKYHKPLGISIFVLILANLILAFFK